MTSTQGDGWIKMSERKPTEKDFPVWAFAKDWSHEIHIKLPGDPMHPDITHWQPAVFPAPPAKELTQRERDEEAFDKWFTPLFGLAPHQYSLGQRASWHAALAYRDGQNRENLKHNWVKDYEQGFAKLPIEDLTELQRRCGLDT